MGHYTGGDVLLASVRIGGPGACKVRPVVVISTGENGNLLVCPVSSSPSFDGPSIPLSLEDFARGGLDLFGESRPHRIPFHHPAGRRRREERLSPAGDACCHTGGAAGILPSSRQGPPPAVVFRARSASGTPGSPGTPPIPGPGGRSACRSAGPARGVSLRPPRCQAGRRPP